jgi:DNA-binding transcriptional LysR family regulator
VLDGTPPDAAVEAIDDSISDGGLARDNDVRDLQARADRIDVPVYFATSYFDRLVPASNTTNIYERLRARAADKNDPYYGTDVRLILSNDAHGDIGSNFAVLTDLFTWLERQLEDDPTPLRDAPVASAQEWDGSSFRLEHEWPIAGTKVRDRFLSVGDDGPQLTSSMPKSSTADVANVPVIGTGPWIPVAGSAIEVQTIGLLPGDSVRYRSARAGSLTEITGTPVAHLWLSTPDGGSYGQVTIALEEVDSEGTVTQFARIRRGFSDLSATPTEKVIPLSTSSWRIDPTHRLQLTVIATDIAQALPALTNRSVVISHGPKAPSRLEVPTVDPNRALPPGAPPSGTSFTADPGTTLCSALGLPCPWASRRHQYHQGMDRADLELVVAIGRTGSLTAAARLLHTAQPPLSRRLQALERAVGAQLFTRGRHGAVPTVVGRTLIERAGEALDAITRAEQDASDVAAGRAGRLRFGVTPTLGAELLPASLAGLRASHPSVRIDLASSGDAAGLRSGVRNGELDVAICTLDPDDEAGVRVAARGQQRFVLIAPADMRLTKGSSRRVSTRALVGLPLVVISAGEGLRVVVDQLLADLGAEPVITIETSEREMLVPFVVAGLGASIVPEGFARQRPAAGLSIYPLEPPVKRSVGIVIGLGHPGALVTAFVDEVVRVGDFTRRAARSRRTPARAR